MILPLHCDIQPNLTFSLNRQGEYVTDVDSELAKCAIRSLGSIAVRIPAVAQEMTQTIVELVDMDSVYVRSQAAIVLADIVRIHPAAVQLVLPHLCRCIQFFVSSSLIFPCVCILNVCMYGCI